MWNVSPPPLGQSPLSSEAALLPSPPGGCPLHPPASALARGHLSPFPGVSSPTRGHLGGGSPARASDALTPHRLCLLYELGHDSASRRVHHLRRIVWLPLRCSHVHLRPPPSSMEEETWPLRLMTELSACLPSGTLRPPSPFTWAAASPWGQLQSWTEVTLWVGTAATRALGWASGTEGISVL